MPFLDCVLILSHSPTKSTQQSRVIAEFLAAGLFKLIEEVSYGQFFLFFTLNVEDDSAFHHHDQTISMNDRILHIVCDHHGRQVISVYDHFCDFKNLGCSLRIKSSGMFIQKQKLWFLERIL